MTARRSSLPIALALAALLALPTAAAAGEAPAAPAPAPAAPEKENEGDSGRNRPETLEQKIRPVSGNLFLKDGRFEMSPGVGISLSDAFFQKYSVGLKLDYHLSESFGIGAHASYSLATPAGAVQVCKDDNCRTPELSDLQDVPGKVGLMAGAELAWSPIYGKLNVLAEKVLHFDLSLIGGVSVIQYQAPGGKDAMTLGGHVGIGQRYFVTRSMTVRLELRDYIYSAEIPRLGTSDRKIENQLMFELGLSFFLGEPRE